MRNVCLCIGNYAKKPFYVKFSENYLYSMEELCYYFIEKIYVIDQELMSFDLVTWIREECGLKELADELETFVRKKVSLAIFVTTILEKTGIYDNEVIKKVEKILREQAELSPYERWKRKADYDYQAGRFRQALRVYSDLLKETPMEQTQLRATLYYNMASVYAMDFAYEQAAAYYEESNRLVESKQTRLAYILAVKRSMSDYEFGAFMRSHGEWKEEFEEIEVLMEQALETWESSKAKEVLDEMLKEKKSGHIGEYYQKRRNLIIGMKEEYRKQTR